jgi:hypothetical protein
VELPETSAISEFLGRYSWPIILNGAISPAVVDRYVDLGGTSIQRVGDKATDYPVQGRDVDRRFDLVDDILRKLSDDHTLRRVMLVCKVDLWLWY